MKKELNTKSDKKDSKASVKKTLKTIPKKLKLILLVVVTAIAAVVVLGVIFLSPISKNEAAEKLGAMLDSQNTLTVEAKNAAKVFDIDQLRETSKNMVAVLEANIKDIKDTKWPEGLSRKTKRLSGDTVSDMDLYAKDLEDCRDFYQNVANASDDTILEVYSEDAPYSVMDVDDFRAKLGMPSAAAESSKYHEYTEDEVTEKLQENAVDVNLSKFYINCEEKYGYTMCDSNLDVAVRNKSKVNFTDGGMIEITAYDQSGNPIETGVVYLGNRLESGQTIKQKLFEYVRDEYRDEYLDNPTFKITKIEIYNY